MSAPPPPPPHGEPPKSSGLPPGNYDIFIIPPHSSGSGFLYLPSLQTHRNSFLAGVACTLGVVGLWVMVAPMARHVYHNYITTSGVAMAMVLCGFSFAAYHIGSGSKVPNMGTTGGPSAGAGAGSSSQQHPPNPGAGQSYAQSPPGGSGGYNQAPPPPPPPPPGGSSGYTHAPPPQPQPGFTQPNPGSGFASGASTAGAKPSWQRTNPTSASGWEKAREEMKKAQEEKRRKEEAEKKAKEAAEKERWEKATARAKELREKLAREKEAKEKLEKERLEKEKADKERAEREAKRKMEQEERDKAKAASAAASSVPKHNYQKPTASSYLGEEDAYSYRPYDKPLKHGKTASQSSFYSASSYAASQTTARTTPPPSHRGPYVNKDPDKITIKAVYAFSDHFPKPTAELVSGTGNVTDGLVLKMTTEGLFIDDDVRGVPQREWDVRAWTMKLVEVWCPSFCARYSRLIPGSRLALKKEKNAAVRFVAGADTGSAPMAELDTVLAEMQLVCSESCREEEPPAFDARSFDAQSFSGYESRSNSSRQNGDLKGKHILRATIRDAENKKYVFVIDEAEAWKVAVGLQRVRRGSQVRSLNVSGLSQSEMRNILTLTGWA